MAAHSTSTQLQQGLRRRCVLRWPVVLNFFEQDKHEIVFVLADDIAQVRIWMEYGREVSNWDVRTCSE